MPYSNVRFSDGSMTWVAADFDGEPIMFRAQSGLVHYDAIVAAGIAPMVDLDHVKAWEAAEIDRMCGAMSPQLDATRRIKLDEAEEVLANGGEGRDFPMLTASALPGESLAITAKRVFDAFTASTAGLAATESTRLEAKRRIRAAATVDDVLAVRASITWSGS